MRQVPRYLLIGNGRLARHLQHYLSQLGLQYTTWHRSDTHDDLTKKTENATHILVLISDQAIDHFIEQHLKNTHARIIHCSGSHTSAFAISAHPLMTFSHTLYEPEIYPTIPFIIDEDAPAFEELLPGLPNPHARLNKALKTKYHALCVLAGNFSCLLWQKLFDDFSKELDLPANTAHPYLQQITKNLIHTPQSALTGPLTRQDHQTIARHMSALENDPFQTVYQSFVDCYHTQNAEKAK